MIHLHELLSPLGVDCHSATRPVGSLFITSSPDNPALSLGYGTWVRLAKGQTIIGVDEDDPDFDAPGKTGGTKSHTLTVSEMPSHGHTVQATSVGIGAGVMLAKGSINPADFTVPATGGGEPHNNLSPYTTFYLWGRVA